jgi:hypothetical protein
MLSPRAIPRGSDTVALVLSFALVLSLALASPASAQTGAISGVVTDSASRRPIAGALVSLQIQGPTQAPNAGGRIERQITDSRGRFVFDELAASSDYVLRASKPGYLDGRYATAPGLTAVSRIALADGQWFSMADVAMIKVGAIGGVVTDEAGDPVVGAFVRALVEITVGGRRQLAAGPTSKTNDRGEYRLTGLVAGRYIVMIPSVQNTVPATATPAEIEGLREDMYVRLEAQIAQGRASAQRAIDGGAARLIIGNFGIPPPPADGHDRAYPITFFPGTTAIASATRIDLTGGDDRSGVNINLHPVPAVRVSGRVDGMTSPVKLTLRLVPAGLEGFGSGSEAATTIVSPDGSFAFLGVPAGTYTLDARQALFQFSGVPIPAETTSLPRTPGRALLGRQIQSPIVSPFPNAAYSLQMEPPGPSYFGQMTIAVGSADVVNVVMTLQPMLTIRGRFMYEDMPNGPPRRPLILIAEPAGSAWTQGIAASDPEADMDITAFIIANITEGSWVLHPALAPGVVVKSIVVDGRDHSKKPIEISRGRELRDVVVTLTGKGATVSGVVRVSATQAGGTAILAFTTDRSVWPDLGLAPRWVAMTMASSDGAFRLPPIAAGEYYVAAVDVSRGGARTDPAFLEQVAASATRVSLEWGGSKTLELTPVIVK